MKLTFLGSGSAFTIDNYQSNMLIEEGNKKMLVDCGSDIRFALRDIDLTYKDIEAVYISHLHADHAGGLEWLGFTRKFDPSVDRATLYINDFLQQQLWANTLAGGMSCLQGEFANLSSFFNTHIIPSDGGFKWMGIDFQLVQTIHAINGFMIVSSFGLMIKNNNQYIYITTDTQFCPEQIIDWYNKADIIFQDCETSPFKSGVHAHYNELITLDTEIKNKMWLYHYQDGMLPDAVKDGFKGFVKKGQLFTF